MNKEKRNQIKDDIKSRLSIVDFISKHVQLDKYGKDYKGKCPFHSEKTASFVVSEGKGIFKCFGCGEHGNIINFLMKKENLPFLSALRRLSEESGIELPSINGGDVPHISEFNDFSINEIASNYFHQKLIYSSEELSKFRIDRQLDIDTIKEFNLGFCPSNDIKGLKEQYNRSSHINMAKKIGLIKESDSGDYCMFYNRLIFPIKNHYGKVAGFAGRTLVEHKIKYLNSSASVVYEKHSILYGYYEHKDEIRRSENAILVEGYTDLLRLHQEGVKNVVAMCGTAFTHEQAQEISELTKSITFLFDGDSAGIKSAISKSKIALAFGLKLKIALLPDNHDPDSYVIENGIDALKELLTNAKDPFSFCAEYLSENNPDKLDSIDLTESIATTLCDMMAVLPKSIIPIVTGAYKKKISELTGLEIDDIKAEIERIKSTQRVSTDDDIAILPTPTEEENAEIEHIISKDNLSLAWKKIYRFAQTHDVYFDSREFDDFSNKKDAYIELLHHQLKDLLDKDETWVPEPFRMLKIKKQSGDYRELVIPSKIQDRIVIQAVLNIIAPEVEKVMSPNSFGHRISNNYSTSDDIFTPWTELYGNYHVKLRAFLDSPEEYYYLKGDIASFYPNIPVEDVIEKVQPFVKSEWSINIISNFLNYQIYQEDGSVVSPENKGLPQGPAYGHLLANVYLNDLDTFIEDELAITHYGKTTKELFEDSDDEQKVERIWYRYSRYVDDIYILFKSEADAIAGRTKIEEKLNPLELKDEKTEIIPITDTSHIIDEIKKKKYDLGKFFEFENSLSGDQKDILYRIVSDEYLNVTNQESLLELNHNINQIVHNLKGTKYFDENEDDLTNLVIELIFSESFKYSSADSLFKKMLPSILSENHESKFLSHLEEAEPFKVLLVLQAIGRHGFYDDLSDTFQEYIRNLLSHKNYYVRIGASDCLSISKQDIVTNSLKSKIDTEENIEVKKALLYLTPFQDTMAIRVYIQRLIKTESKLQKRIVQLLLDRDKTLAISMLKQIEKIDSDATVTILQFILSSPTRESINLLNRLSDINNNIHGILENLLDDIMNDYYLHPVLCFDLISNIEHINNESILMTMKDRVVNNAIEKAVENEEDQEVIDKLSEEKHKIEKRTLAKYSEILKFAKDRVNYKSEGFAFLGSQGIKYHAYRSKKDGSVVSFEIIDESLIPDGKTIEEYRKELEQFRIRKIIYFETASIVIGEKGIRQLILKYEFKSTWNLIVNRIKQEHLSEKTMAGIITEIQNKYERQYMAGYPSPYTIALDSFNNAVFVHVGSSLITPQYKSHLGKFRKDDTDTFDSLFLGWLSFEMLTQECPITEQIELKKDETIDSNKRFLSNSPKLFGMTLPYTRLLKRLTYDDATFRKPLRSFPPKIDIRHYRIQLDEIQKVKDGFGKEIAYKYSYLNYISSRVRDYLLRSGIKRDDIGGSVQYAIQTLIDELIYFEKSRGFNYFHDFESELLSDEYFHLGSQQLLKFEKRLLKVQNEINGFEVNYKPNLLIIYLTLRVELLAIAYRFILAFKDIWKSEYAKSSKKEKKGKLFLQFIQKIDPKIDKAWWKKMMNKYASDVTSLLDEKQTQDYLINSSLSGLILFISMAQPDRKSCKMKQELLDVVELEMKLSKYFKTTKIVSKDVYLEVLDKMKSIVYSMKGKFKADEKIFEFVEGCVFYQVSDAKLTDGKSTQEVAVSKIVFPTTNTFDKTRIKGEQISCDLIDGDIVSAVPIINKLHILSEQATIIDTEFVESSEGTGHTDEITSFDFAISDDDIKIVVNKEYTIEFLDKMIGRYKKSHNAGYIYLKIMAPKHKKGEENSGVSKNSFVKGGIESTKVDKVRSDMKKELKLIIKEHQLSIKADDIIPKTHGGKNHILGEKCSIFNKRDE